MAKRDKAAVRRAVHTRIRRRVRGNSERPRLAIFRSLNHIYAQVIDDERAVTIASASTRTSAAKKRAARPKAARRPRPKGSFRKVSNATTETENPSAGA